MNSYIVKSIVSIIRGRGKDGIRRNPLIFKTTKKSNLFFGTSILSSLPSETIFDEPSRVSLYELGYNRL